MNDFYASLVLASSNSPDSETILKLDAALSCQSSMHEILIVTPRHTHFPSLAHDRLHGVIKHVEINQEFHPQTFLFFGLSRAIGDVVLVWSPIASSLSEDLLNHIFEQFQAGCSPLLVYASPSLEAHPSHMKRVPRRHLLSSPDGRLLSRE